MSEEINEYINMPDWVAELTPEQVQDWYEHAKWVVKLLTDNGDDATQLINAIRDYEVRHNINENK